MKKVLLIYYIFALILVAGFAAHGSEVHEIYIYSKKYLAGLVVLAILMLAIIPWWINRFINKNGTKNFFMSLIPTLVTLFLIYIGGHYYYYATQKHLFDPFMQMPPQTYQYETQKDTNSFRILCVGGSTTRNVRLDSMEQYPTVLQKILKDKIPNKKIEMLNAGMDWYTSRHSNINYTLYCRDFKPDVVVIMHAINDLYRSFSPPSLAVGEYKSDYTHFYGPSIAGAKPPTFESMINTFVRKFWFPPTYEARSFDISKFKSLDDFSKYMGTLVELVQNDGAKVILVSQPYLYKSEMPKEEKISIWMNSGMCLENGEYPDSETMALAMDAYNAKTAILADKYHLKFVHGEPALPKDLVHFVDDVHYTPAGAKKLAEVIAKGIISLEKTQE